MTVRKFVRTLLVLLTAITALLALLSCSRTLNDDIFSFAASDSAFTLVFPSDLGEIKCACTKKGALATAEIIYPTRSAGTVITYDGNVCTINIGETKIPLSEDAASKLTVVFDTIFRGADGASISRSADGKNTVVSYPDATLVLGENHAPTSVECGRIIAIEDFVISK